MTVVGRNKYRLAKEEPLETLDIDNDAVRRAQVERLKQVRAERDESKVRAALNAITEAAETGKGNLLERGVEVARARATLGEISDAMAYCLFSVCNFFDSITFGWLCAIRVPGKKIASSKSCIRGSSGATRPPSAPSAASTAASSARTRRSKRSTT
uniref:Methylmalonyl-CoA mutase n=1 Tax=Candidatus Kentrum sp. TC TaxID=2126339 RepID=A0A451A374_9GAMM|nr:MAG: Methylmalonyl-CoA mutase [Candidatus Kentron sp. TC]